MVCITYYLSLWEATTPTPHTNYRLQAGQSWFPPWPLLWWTATQLHPTHRVWIWAQTNNWSIFHKSPRYFQHRTMVKKLLDMTGDLDLCQAIFNVQLNDQRSKWKAQKNNLPQGHLHRWPLLHHPTRRLSEDSKVPSMRCQAITRTTTWNLTHPKPNYAPSI